jgi:hypothetical protein
MFAFETKFAPGQQVIIKSLNVTGFVWQVCIMPNKVINYDCFWWFNGERKNCLLTEAEIAEA